MCYLTIEGLDEADPGKLIRLRGRIHAAARTAAEGCQTTYDATGSAISIGIRGPDAAGRISQLRHALAQLTARHGWTLREQSGRPGGPDAGAARGAGLTGLAGPPPVLLPGHACVRCVVWLQAVRAHRHVGGERGAAAGREAGEEVERCCGQSVAHGHQLAGRGVQVGVARRRP